MNNRFAVVTLLLLAMAVPVVAQEKTENPRPGSMRLSVFGTNFGYTESDLSGSNWHGGFGLSLEYRLRERWSTELAISREEAPAGYFFDITPGVPVSPRRLDVVSYPVDLTANYHFLTRSAWKPFVGAGLRYTNAPEVSPYGELEGARLSPQLVGGVHYNLTRHVALRLDVKRLLRNDSAYFEDDRKVGVGVGFSW